MPKFATQTERFNRFFSNVRQPKGFGFGALDVAKSVANRLGISGIENIKPIWQLARQAIETANPCQCEDRCFCNSCMPYGCTTCFSQIYRYVLNRMGHHNHQ